MNGINPSHLDRIFPRYREFDPAVPIWCLTPEHPRTIHRFFDTNPISPSGRFVGLTRLPSETTLPRPGDAAEVVVVDLSNGELRVVATTRAWDTQLGAQVQWGSSDREMYFNDIDTKANGDWAVNAVRYDAVHGILKRVEGAMYFVSPDGERSIHPCLRRIGATQPGYGVHVPPNQIPVNHGAPDDDGLYITDLQRGGSRLLVSLRAMVEAGGLDTEESDYYAFLPKWNPQGDRVAVIVRQLPRVRQGVHGGKPHLFTMRPDGSDIRHLIDGDVWSRGGHHPDFSPDGQHVTMNLKDRFPGLRFFEFDVLSGRREVLHESIYGSGHPRLHPVKRCLITDTYIAESPYDDGTTPLRWVNFEQNQETELARIRTRPHCADLGIPGIPAVDGGPLRVDPHPAWNRSFTAVTFNACPDGERQVFLADLSSLL